VRLSPAVFASFLDLVCYHLVMSLKDKHLLDATMDAMREAEELARISLYKGRACSKAEIRRATRSRVERRWLQVAAQVRPAFDPVDPIELSRSFYLRSRMPPGQGVDEGVGGQDDEGEAGK